MRRFVVRLGQWPRTCPQIDEWTNFVLKAVLGGDVAAPVGLILCNLITVPL